MTFAELVARLRAAQRITVLTGAGVSAPSGVPTFRGAEGLWRRFRPEDLATPEAFARDPRLVWEWYDWRRQHIAHCVPNEAHCVLARWSARWPGLTVVTQNVDGLHERAGSDDVLRLHGSIWDVRCWRGCRAGRQPRPLPEVPLRVLPPACPYCQGLDRPGVVWFGEALDQTQLAQAASAAHGSDVFLSVGTSAVVYPAAGLIDHARRAGACLVEINAAVTTLSASMDLAIRQSADLALAALDGAL
jgi:NAD-dependent deacetylase